MSAIMTGSYTVVRHPVLVDGVQYQSELAATWACFLKHTLWKVEDYWLASDVEYFRMGKGPWGDCIAAKILHTTSQKEIDRVLKLSVDTGEPMLILPADCAKTIAFPAWSLLTFYGHAELTRRWFQAKSDLAVAKGEKAQAIPSNSDIAIEKFREASEDMLGMFDLHKHDALQLEYIRGTLLVNFGPTGRMRAELGVAVENTATLSTHSMLVSVLKQLTDKLQSQSK